MDEALVGFIRESNRIEGIEREPTDDELSIHGVFLSCPTLLVSNIEGFVWEIAARPLRDRSGMNVRVGHHIPPAGDPDVRTALEILVGKINAAKLDPYAAHVAYEQLHPFLDGNGRSGRAIWAWQMKRDGQDPFTLPFLHRFYYQALDASRR